MSEAIAGLLVLVLLGVILVGAYVVGYIEGHREGERYTSRHLGRYAQALQDGLRAEATRRGCSIEQVLAELSERNDALWPGEQRK